MHLFLHLLELLGRLVELFGKLLRLALALRHRAGLHRGLALLGFAARAVLLHLVGKLLCRIGRHVVELGHHLRKLFGAFFQKVASLCDAILHLLGILLRHVALFEALAYFILHLLEFLREVFHVLDPLLDLHSLEERQRPVEALHEFFLRELELFGGALQLLGVHRLEGLLQLPHRLAHLVRGDLFEELLYLHHLVDDLRGRRLLFDYLFGRFLVFLRALLELLDEFILFLERLANLFPLFVADLRFVLHLAGDVVYLLAEVALAAGDLLDIDYLLFALVGDLLDDLFDARESGGIDLANGHLRAGNDIVVERLDPI